MTIAAANPSAGRILGKALIWALAGLVIAPVAVFALVLILSYFDKVCGTPGHSGGCEMGLATATIASALPGARIGFVGGLVRGLRQKAQSVARTTRSDIRD